MAVLSLHSGRTYFASRVPLPMMVYTGGSREASELAPHLGVEPEQVIAAFNRSLRNGIAVGGMPVFLAGAVLTASELRWLARDAPMQTVALDEIADFRPGFDVAELVRRDGERIRWPGELIPFLRLCVECMRECAAT